HAVVVERSRMAGMVLSTADATVEQTIFRDVTADDLGRNGDGVYAENALLTLSGSLVVRTVEGGVVLNGATGTIDASDIDDVTGHLAAGVDHGGDGLVVITGSATPPGSAHVTRSRVEHCHRAGIANFGATLEL